MARCRRALALAALLLAAALAYEPVRERRAVHDICAALGAAVGAAVPGDGAPRSGPLRVGVGVNACTDMVTNATLVLRGLLEQLRPADDAPGRDDDNKNGGGGTTAQLATARALLGAFAEHFAAGTAAERHITNATLFAQLLRIAAAQDGTLVAPGGNAALMGAAMLARSDNVRVLLGAGVGPSLRALLPPRMETLSACALDSDEVHLILEYAEADRWLGLTGTAMLVPRAWPGGASVHRCSAACCASLTHRRTARRSAARGPLYRHA